jgi:hypothetical protein
MAVAVGVPAPQLYSHQVAGHVEESLLSLSGRFILKPLVKSSLFEREKAFYETQFSETHNSNCAIPFTPRYLGLLHHKGQNGHEVMSHPSRHIHTAYTLYTHTLIHSYSYTHTHTLILIHSYSYTQVPHLVLEDLTCGYRRY